MKHQHPTPPPLRAGLLRLAFALIAIISGIQGQCQIRLLPADGVDARGGIKSDTLRVMYGDIYVTTLVKDSLLGGFADLISAAGPDFFVGALVSEFCGKRKFSYSVMIQRYLYDQGELHVRDVHRYEVGVLDLNKTGCTLEFQGHRLQIWMNLNGYGRLGMATTLHSFNDGHMRDFFEAFQKVIRRAPRMKGWPYAPSMDDI
jgi:hypothetical protein